MRVLLILPAYNEEETIVKTIERIRETRFPEDLQVDYVVINDGSKDRTEELCRKNNIPCVSLVQNLGIGGAVQAGYLFAVTYDYDVAVQFDGDGQHDIASLPNLINPIANGEADFTVGSRFVDDSRSEFRSTFLRRVGISYLSGVIRVVTGVKVRDVTSGYRAGNREVVKFLSENYPVDYPEPESLVHLKKHGFHIKEVPANMFERSGGQSSIHSFKSIYYMLKVVAILCAAIQKGSVSQ